MPLMFKGKKEEKHWQVQALIQSHAAKQQCGCQTEERKQNLKCSPFFHDKDMIKTIWWWTGGLWGEQANVIGNHPNQRKSSAKLYRNLPFSCFVSPSKHCHKAAALPSSMCVSPSLLSLSLLFFSVYTHTSRPLKYIISSWIFNDGFLPGRVDKNPALWPIRGETKKWYGWIPQAGSGVSSQPDCRCPPLSSVWLYPTQYHDLFPNQYYRTTGKITHMM